MAKPLVVSIPHNLGTQEAARRLRQGVGQMKSQFGDKIASVEDHWTGDRMDFQVAMMSQTVAGHLDVMEDCVRVEVQLPWLLEKIAEKTMSFIRKQGTHMLEKK